MFGLRTQLLSLLLVLLTASAGLAADKLTIYAVNDPLASLSKALLGPDVADVVMPVPAGQDPALWRPGLKDISAMQQADLVVVNGLGYAAWLKRVSLPRSKMLVSARGLQDWVLASDTITHSHGNDGAHAHTGQATHLWLDPALASLQAKTLAQGFQRAFARRGLSETDMTARLAALSQDFAVLDARLEALAARMQGLRVITSHPRYPYLARRLGWQLRSLEWGRGEVDLTSLEALLAQGPADLLVLEAEVTPQERARIEALDLSIMVLDPLDHLPAGQTLPQALAVMLETLEGER